MVVACDLAGLRVPEDVAVLGCDNHWVEQGLSPISLSTRGHELQGHWLEGRFRVGSTHASALPPAASSGCRPPGGGAAFHGHVITDSPAVTAAVVYLREHYREAVAVGPSWRTQSGMSERVLESGIQAPGSDALLARNFGAHGWTARRVCSETRT